MKTFSGLCVLLFASVAGWAPAARGASSVPYSFRNDLKGHADNYRGSQEREGKIIGFFKDLAERRSDRLTIKIKDGEPLSFVNQKKSPDGSIAFYSLVDVNSKNHTLVVEKGLDEGRTYLLIDYVGGKQIELAGLPYWSPSGARFAVMDPEISDFSPALLHIWRLHKGEFIREWETTGYAAASGRWATDERIEFAVRRVEAERFEGERKASAGREEKWECAYRPKHFDDAPSGWLCRSNAESEDEDSDSEEGAVGKKMDAESGSNGD